MSLFAALLIAGALPAPLYREVPPHLQTAAEVEELQFFVNQPAYVTGAIVVRYESSSLTASSVTVPLPGGKSVTFDGKVQISKGANVRVLAWRTADRRLDLVQFGGKSPNGWIWDGETWHVVYWSANAAIIWTPTHQDDAPK